MNRNIYNSITISSILSAAYLEGKFLETSFKNLQFIYTDSQLNKHNAIIFATESSFRNYVRKL
jgi:UDP-N-acetylenolpyruvoylglucosamine reductase